MSDPAHTSTSASAAPRRSLVLKVGGQVAPAEFELMGVPAEIGRLETLDITLDHRSVSRRHARVRPNGDGYVVEDLSSRNGTWLNDTRIAGPTPLSDGDRLMIGDVPLIVDLPAIETPPPPAPPPPDTSTPATRLSPATVMIGIRDALSGFQASLAPSRPLPEEPPSADVEPLGPHATLPRSGAAEHDDDRITVTAPVSAVTDPPTPSAPPIDLSGISPTYEPSTVTLTRLAASADAFAENLRTFSADLATAIYLFEHAGGARFAQTFIDQVNLVYEQPEDPKHRDDLLELVPGAARLLQAAAMLVQVLAPLQADGPAGRRDESQTHSTKLEPVVRP